MQHADKGLRQWVRASLQLSTFLGVAMIAVIWAGLALHLNMEEQSAVASAKQNSGNLARAFEEHVVRSIEQGDKVLLALRAAYAKNPAQFDIENARVYLDNLILQVGVIGPDGFLKATTNAPPPGARIDLGDREHYRVHLNTDKDELFISKPVTGRTTGQSSIQLTRRLANPDGSFGGVIVASIDQSYLMRFYDSVDVGKDGNILLVGLDGIVRAARGYKKLNPNQSFNDSSLFKNLYESPTGFFETLARADGIERLMSYRKIGSLPLIVAVGLAQHEVFADYWRDRRIYYIGAVVLTVLILIVTGIGAARNRKLALSEALKRAKLLLESALEHMPHGLCMFSRDQRLIVANKLFAEMYGLAPEQAKPGTTLSDILYARVAAGYCPENTEKYVSDRLNVVPYEVKPGCSVDELKNGRVFLVRWQPMQGGGWVATHEDITERHWAEARAAAANQKLIEQQYAIDQAVIVAVTDLTGRITYANDNFCRISGYACEELLGANHRILKSGFHPEKFYRDMYCRIAAGQVWRAEVCNKAKDGSLHWLDTTIVPQLGPDGKPIGYMAIRVDVTERKKAEAELGKTRAFLSAVIDNLPIMITVKDARDLSYVLVNRASEKIFKLPVAQMIGKRAPDIVAPGQAALFEARDREVLNGRQLVSFEHEIELADGAVRCVQAMKVPILGDDGEPQYLITHSQDITERRQLELERERDRAFLNTIVENVPTAIIVKNARDRRFVLVNRAYEEIHGISRDNVIGKSSYDIFPQADADNVSQNDDDLLRTGEYFYEHQVQTPGKGTRIVAVKKLVIRGSGGEPQYLLGVIDDVTERKRAEERISYLARHDALTGIANRTVLREKLEEALARLQSRRDGFAVFILDLDEFKYINDTLGHSTGDQLLKELALRLQSSMDETDFVARLGGDEFAIIQSGVTNQREGAIALAVKVLDIVGRPFDLDGYNVTVQTSIGIALAPENGAEPGELLKKADLALYRVKSEGRNSFSFFEEAMSKDATARHQLLNDLRAALSRNEFELHYQPIVDAKTTRPCGAEALVRWRHPVKGVISPDRFIWLAEESGLMEPLGEWILERACADAASWPENIKVAVNLSAVQFRSGKLFDVILCALVESGLSPERLELEITESVLLQNKDGYGVMIQQLKNIGISIVLDDFGTGYSSLSYLTRFPFGKIKIDKSFTQGLSSRADCAAVVASVLTLARGLDMVVTAEGVETKQEFELLRAAGAHQIQGYLFGRPVPVAELDFSALERKGQAVEAA
ncbi:MAG: EAL domain-containing protein [Xanthobacteraceae bacterium]